MWSKRSTSVTQRDAKTSSVFGFASSSRLRNEAALVPPPPAQPTTVPEATSAAMRTWGRMQSLDGELVLSATDLVGFAECVHRTTLDREVALGLRPKPDRVDPLGEILALAGLENQAG